MINTATLAHIQNWWTELSVWKSVWTLAAFGTGVVYIYIPCAHLNILPDWSNDLRKWLWGFALVILPLGILVWCLGIFFEYGGIPRHIDTSFATSASMKEHYDGRTIDSVVSDRGDVRALKGIFARCAFITEYPACMFDESVSITLSDGHKSLTLCPAFDGDPSVAPANSNETLQMSYLDRKKLDRICRKYGVIFPVR